MRKLLVLFLLLTMPLMASDSSFGYFFLNYQQLILGKYPDAFYSILWNPDLAKHDGGVFLDREDFHNIILDEKGYYSVTYNVTIENANEDVTYRFALLLNFDIVEGSIYGRTASDSDSVVQLYGQAIVHACHHCNVLQLVNDTVEDVSIIPIWGTDEEPHSVSVSILIHKL